MSSSSSITTICFCSLCALAASSVAQEQLSTTTLPRSLQATNTFVNLYETVTTVDASIDKDIRAIFSKTNLRTQAAFEEAKKLYSQGAYAGSYATLQIDASSLTGDLVTGTAVQGVSSNRPNQPAMGFVMETVPAGSTSIPVQYTTDCYVGGLSTPIVDHCLKESTGDQTIRIGKNGQEIAYTYSPLQDTQNALTLELLGKGNSSSPTYSAFFDYSGAYDYANQILMAAFQGSATSFPNQHTNMDFSKLDHEGRAAAIRWGMAGMNVHSQVLEKLHQATESCNEDEGATHYWDEAVGFYAGSLTDFPGEEGYLLFTVAEMECSYFGTCSEGSMAHVNEAIFVAFLKGKEMLQKKQCQELIEVSSQIKSLMMIPLVQRILRHAYELDLQENQQAITQGDAAAFMASLAPYMYACQRSSAHMLWNDLAPGNATKASFEVLKFTLERTYDCLGIRCEDVGGLLHIDPSGSGLLYNKGAEPCGYVPPASESLDKTAATSLADKNNKDRNQTASTLVFVALGLLVSALLAAFVRYRLKKPTKVLTMERTADVVSNNKEETTVAVQVGEIA